MTESVNIDAGLEEGTVFHLLGNDRRREVILEATKNETISVSELADNIATKEAQDGTSPEELYKSVYVSLQQTHLPKLAAEEIIRYEPDTKTIRPGPRLDDIEIYIDRDTGRGFELSVPFVVSLVGLAVIVGVLLHVPILRQIHVGLWGLAILLIVILSLVIDFRSVGQLR